MTKGMTWTFEDTGCPAFFSRMVSEYGAEAVGNVLTERDSYPPMIDAGEREEIEERLQDQYIAAAWRDNPAIRPALARMGYTAQDILN